MKKIVFPCELKVEFDEVGEITVSVHYGIASEDVEARRGISLDLSDAELKVIIYFVKNVVLPKIKERESIA